MLPNCLRMRWNSMGVYVDESIRLISHKCRNDTKAATAHLTYWYPTICFLDTILWFGLHFPLVRSTKCICQSLKEDFRWGCKIVWWFYMPVLSMSSLRPQEDPIWFSWSFILRVCGGIEFWSISEAPEIKPMIDRIGKFQSDWWIAQQGIYMLRDSLCS